MPIFYIEFDPILTFFRNIGIVIVVAGFATVFVALLYCTCICKESQRVAPDGNPYNVRPLFPLFMTIGLRSIHKLC